MTRDEVQAILADLHAAHRALRDSGAAFDTAVEGVGALLADIQRANHAQGRAIDAILAATEKALAGFQGPPQ